MVIHLYGALPTISRAICSIMGFGPSDGRCLPCSGVSGRAITISSGASSSDHTILSHFKVVSLKCAFKRPTFTCNANSSGHKRNQDFPRQHKQGFSRGRNRQNEERDNYDNFDDSELFSSKNGPLLSLSNGPKFQATAIPGPREKEIVELFRKVQAQLRERAALKEEQKHEAKQGQGKESETVDSLLKLLRKHSVEQGRRRTSSGSSRDVIAYQPEQNGAFREEKRTSFSDSNRIVRDEAQEPRVSSPSRPRSKFRRKSPVPPGKYQHVYSTEGSVNSTSHLNSGGNRETSFIETLPVSGPEDFVESQSAPEPEGELQPELEPSFSDEPVLDEMSEFEPSDTDEAYNDANEEDEEGIQQTDLSAMKLADLRLLAKSRGLKRFSKLKKQELVELLDGRLT
ncbi:Rho termination factor, N-terminal [Dillenia turbinata]|uniref:Rho termination factor, N-terminal n=1 Tax=Dillenia turbinata TaxID=194707 RepID=A0AAN8W0P2_9MAGN